MHLLRRPMLWAVALLLAVPSPAMSACEAESCIAVAPPAAERWVDGDVELTRFEGDAFVRDGLANTRVLLAIRNPHGEAVAVNVSVLIPPEAALLAFNVSTPLRMLVGRIISEEDLPFSNSGPVQVLQADARIVRLRIELAPGESYTVRAQYLEWVPMAGGHYVYRLPTTLLGLTPGAFRLTFQLEESAGVHGLRFPGMPLGLVYQSEVRKSARFVQEGIPVPHDMVAVWRAGQAGWDADLFMAPPQPGRLEQEAILRLCLNDQRHFGRDVTFVLDRSGSMAGNKIEQAREGVRLVLQGLNYSDAYTVVTFDHLVEAFSRTMVQGHPQIVAADRYRLAFLEPRGFTNIHGGLMEGLRQLDLLKDSPRVPMVVLLTDGLPAAPPDRTYPTDPREILLSILDNNTRGAAIHVVAIGLDADYTFLQDLATMTGGSYTQLPQNDTQAAARLQRLFEVVARPQLRDMSLTVKGLVPQGPPPQAPVVDDCILERYTLRLRDPPPVHVYLNATGVDGPVNLTYSFDQGQRHLVDGLDRLWGLGHLDLLNALARVHPGPAMSSLLIRDAVAYQQFASNVTLGLGADGRVLAAAPVERAIDAPAPKPPTPPTVPTPPLDPLDGNATEDGNATDNETSPTPLPATPKVDDGKRDAAAAAPLVVLAALAAAGFLRRRQRTV